MEAPDYAADGARRGFAVFVRRRSRGSEHGAYALMADERVSQAQPGLVFGRPREQELEGSCGGRARMKTLLLFLVVLWMLTGGYAAFQRGDFTHGNCSTIADTAWVLAVGPLNYAAPETLLRTCNQPTEPAPPEGQPPGAAVGTGARP
jgi:hypothetical protein